MSNNFLRDWKYTIPAGGMMGGALSGDFVRAYEASDTFQIELDNEGPSDFSVGMQFRSPIEFHDLKVHNPHSVPIDVHLKVGIGEIDDNRLQVVDGQGFAVANTTGQDFVVTQKVKKMTGPRGYRIASNAPGASALNPFGYSGTTGAFNAIVEQIITVRGPYGVFLRPSASVGDFPSTQQYVEGNSSTAANGFADYHPTGIFIPANSTAFLSTTDPLYPYHEMRHNNSGLTDDDDVFLSMCATYWEF